MLGHFGFSTANIYIANHPVYALLWIMTIGLYSTHIIPFFPPPRSHSACHNEVSADIATAPLPSSFLITGMFSAPILNQFWVIAHFTRFSTITPAFTKGPFTRIQRSAKRGQPPSHHLLVPLLSSSATFGVRLSAPVCDFLLLCLPRQLALPQA